MRRTLALIVSLLLVGCGAQSSGAFRDPQPGSNPSRNARARIDAAAISGLRAAVAGSLLRHLHDGHLDLSWGEGQGGVLAGPYRESTVYADALGLLALRSLAAHPVPGVDPPAELPGSLSASVAGEVGALAEPPGVAYLLLARINSRDPSSPEASVEHCPAEPTRKTPLGCIERDTATGIPAHWLTPDGRSFANRADESAPFRPVDAIGVGSAIGAYAVRAGTLSSDLDPRQDGAAIVRAELKADVDPHTGLVYARVLPGFGGRREPAETVTHVADQAGMAEMLLEAFDASREHAYMAAAESLLQPLLEDRPGTRVGRGYLAAYDVGGPAPESGVPDLAAAVLVLEASVHYDRDDGDHFARLEEMAASAVLDGARAAGTDDGLSASSIAEGSSRRSGVVTALAVVVLGEVLARR